jgi:hypothetical protein
MAAAARVGWHWNYEWFTAELRLPQQFTGDPEGVVYCCDGCCRNDQVALELKVVHCRCHRN